MGRFEPDARQQQRHGYGHWRMTADLRRPSGAPVRRMAATYAGSQVTYAVVVSNAGPRLMQWHATVRSNALTWRGRRSRSWVAAVCRAAPRRNGQRQRQHSMQARATIPGAAAASHVHDQCGAYPRSSQTGTLVNTAAVTALRVGDRIKRRATTAPRIPGHADRWRIRHHQDGWRSGYTRE